MVLLTCHVCTITVGVSLLCFRCCVYVCPRCICNGIASAFVSASFSASMRAAVPYFPGTTFPRLIVTSCIIIDICSTIFCLSHKSLHTSCILIGMKQPSKKCFLPIHMQKLVLKNSSCGPETAIDGPGTSNEYIGWPNIVDAIGLMNLSTMYPLVLSRALSTMVTNDIYKLSTINTSGGGSFPIISSL